jgi:hypothetical protein
MPVMADGVLLGQGATTISVRKHALNIMAGKTYAGQPQAAQPINGGVAVNG